MKKRIFVIGDESELTGMLKLSLESMGYYNVGEENDALGAVASARQFDPDLIVLDIMMPGLSGFDVLRALRARFTELPPVLIISALDSQAHVQEAIELGAVEYVSKPIDIEFLRHKVRALINAPHRLSSDSARVPVVERTGGAQPLRTDKPAARRNALWIG